MGNQYNAGTFEFYTSDKEINCLGFNNHQQVGFSKNYKLLARHFKPINGIHHYISSEEVEQ